MEAMDAILSRRSIRKYTADPIPETVINELLEAAMSAPSSNNQQPWHFVIIKDRQLLDEIPKYNPYAQMLRHAPLAIAVCADLDLEILGGFWVQDCSACSQNILLAAHATGLGAVWVAVYPLADRIRAVRDALSIPDDVIPFALVSMGYPGEKLKGEDRYDATRVHYDRW